MNTLKKVVAASLVSISIAASTLSAGSEFKFLPIFLDDEYSPQVEVAVVAGTTDFEEGTESGTNYGLDLSFDCPVFTLPGDHTIRQQLTLSNYDKNNIQLTIIEMNPYYFFKLTDSFHLGFGPGISATQATLGTLDSKWIFGWQAGAGVKYYVTKHFLLGADVRKQLLREYDANIDNTRLLVKAGYRF